MPFRQGAQALIFVVSFSPLSGRRSLPAQQSGEAAGFTLSSALDVVWYNPSAFNQPDELRPRHKGELADRCTHDACSCAELLRFNVLDAAVSRFAAAASSCVVGGRTRNRPSPRQQQSSAPRRLRRTPRRPRTRAYSRSGDGRTNPQGTRGGRLRPNRAKTPAVFSEDPRSAIPAFRLLFREGDGCPHFSLRRDRSVAVVRHPPQRGAARTPVDHRRAAEYQSATARVYERQAQGLELREKSGMGYQPDGVLQEGQAGRPPQGA